MKQEKTKVVCSRCKHEWNTSSKTKMVTCAGCGFKTKNSKENI